LLQSTQIGNLLQDKELNVKKKVVILGGGVAGMSAAHELAERGFHVHVYEARPVPGGKARTRISHKLI